MSILILFWNTFSNFAVHLFPQVPVPRQAQQEAVPPVSQPIQIQGQAQIQGEIQEVPLKIQIQETLQVAYLSKYEWLILEVIQCLESNVWSKSQIASP